NLGNSKGELKPAPMRSNCLWYHHDRAARALLGAEPAPFAEIVVELESVAGPEFDHGIVGTNSVAVVALEAVAAGEAPARLIERVRLIESLRDFLEGRAPPRHFEHRSHRFRRVGVVPAVEVLEGGDLVSRCGLIGAAAQPGIDMPRRLLAVADGDRDRPLGRYHIAARENAGMTGHHVWSDPHHAVLDLEPRHTVEERQIDVLPEREHERISLERFELSGRLREPGGVEDHFL